MYSDLESNESKRREVVSSLYWSLMQGWNIPLSIQDYYGLTEDYRLFHQLEGMSPDEYLRKRQTGEVPDILEVNARLTHAVEKIFESVCPRPPAEYLDKLNGELERLASIAASPGSVHDPIHIRPDFLVKYGIDRSSPEDVGGEGLPGTGCPICQDDRQTSLCGRVLQEYQACPHGLLGNNTAEETAHHRPS